MKNTMIKIGFSLVVASAIFTGCGKEAPAPQVQVQAQEEGDFRCRQDGTLAPKWTCDPYVEGAIAAVGIAKKMQEMTNLCKEVKLWLMEEMLS